MRLFDTHCHINDPESFPDPSQAVLEAREAGVDRLVVIGVDPASSLRAVQIAEAHDGVYAAVGWHPNYTASFSADGLAAIEALTSRPRVVAVGEVGLDFYWDHSTPKRQLEALEAQLDMAERVGKPVVFHSRKATSELLDLLAKRRRHPWLLHCFSGTAKEAARACELGCLLGVDGPVTYPKSEELRQVLTGVGLEKLVLETDSPYLAPHLHRGKPNRPALLPLVAEGVAQALGLTAREVAETTTANAERYFGLT